VNNIQAYTDSQHTCPGNLGIIKILRYIKSDKFKIAPHKQKKMFGRKIGPLALCLSTMVNPALGMLTIAVLTFLSQSAD
jgi:hypothetical protein